MDPEELRAWLRLLETPQVGRESARKLLADFGSPQAAMSGQIASLYGDALTAGQNQIVALNRGIVDGMERGHVLALLRDGERTVDKTDPTRPGIKLPDERNGVLFVFRVFDRMSYALILSAQAPVSLGDHFSQP